MGTLCISLFGHLEITRDNRPIQAKIPPIGQALLAYLLLGGCRLHPRDALTDLFWGSYSQKRARSCLRTALWRLRQVLEPADIPRGTYLLTHSRGELGFNWQSSYWLDVSDFEKEIVEILKKPIRLMTATDAINLERTFQLYTCDLLEGFYYEWTLRERERLRQLFLSGLAHLMRFYQNQGDYEQCLSCGQQILQIDPLAEEIHRDMMWLYWEKGQPVMAIRQYKHCEEVLATELQIAPMSETRDLYAKIAARSSLSALAARSTGDPADLQQALHQLHLATQEFEQAQRKLNRAIQIVEQFTT